MGQLVLGELGGVVPADLRDDGKTIGHLKVPLTLVFRGVIFWRDVVLCAEMVVTVDLVPAEREHDAEDVLIVEPQGVPLTATRPRRQHSGIN